MHIFNVPHTVRLVNRKRDEIYKRTEIRYNVVMSKYESQFTQRVIETIENRRRDAKMTIDDLCKASGIGRNSYYAKLRGERCFNTEDIDAVAEALGCDPFLILEEASALEPQTQYASVASQLEDVLGKKIQIEKAAYEDKNKNAESGRENMD